MSERDTEAAIRALESTGDFRVLRRLRPVKPTVALSFPIVGIVVDVETTGLDPTMDEVIELGMVKFLFDRNGQVGQEVARFHSFNEPKSGIPATITELTGITNADVTGARFDAEALANFVGDAGLVIAHNAAFDRPFCESLWGGFEKMSWACSATQIDWRDEGIGGARLEYIAQRFGYFYDAHRALDDCGAVLGILSLTLPKSGGTALAALLAAARRTDVRVSAEGAPFEARLALRARGYRWNDGQNGESRAWWKDIPADEVDGEIGELRTICGPSAPAPRLTRLTAKSRFRRPS